MLLSRSEGMTGQTHSQICANGEDRYATREDFLKIFDQDLNGSNSKDRKRGSEELCGLAHERLATKPSSCGWKVTVYVSGARESCTFLCAYGLSAEHRWI